MRQFRGIFSALTALALCLGMLPVTASATDATGNNHDVTHSGWKTITGTRELSSGNYCLANDVTGDLTISGTVTLCLNGHVLTGTGGDSVIIVNDGANFTLCDCQPNTTHSRISYTGGVITGGTGHSTISMGTGNKVYYGGGGVYVDRGASFTMYGGTIAENNAIQSGNGGGVLSFGIFTMHGGTITNNSASSRGGGVYVSVGTFTMDGGTISDNDAALSGDELYVNTTTNIQGGTIDDGTIYINSGYTLNIYGGYIGSTSITYGTANITGGYFTNGNTTDNTVAGRTVANGYTAVDISQDSGHYNDTGYNEDYPYAVYKTGDTSRYDVADVTVTYRQTVSPVVSGNTHDVDVSYSYSSGEETVSGLPTAVGQHTVTATFAPYIDGANKIYYPETQKTFQVTINRNSSSISIPNSSITATYGDTITISGTVTEATASNEISTLADPAENQVGLYWGDNQLATADVKSDGSFTLTYNTSKKGISATGTSQNLTVKYGGSSDLNAGSANVTITLNPKSVTATVTNTITKVYDGGTTATVSLAVASSDLVNSTDDITVTGTGTYDSAEVGTNIPVTVSDIQTSGDDKDWYTVTAPGNVTGSITQSGSNLSANPSNTNLTYGETLEITVTPTQTGAEPEANNALLPMNDVDTVELYNGTTRLAGTNAKNGDGTYTLTYNTTGKGLSIGENTLTVQFNGDTNMAASTTTVTVNLRQKSVLATLVGTTTKTYDGTTAAPEGLTIGLESMETVDTVSAAGTPAYNSANVDEASTITATGISLIGNDAGWYTLSNSTATTSGSITAAQMTGTVTFDGNAVYNTPLTATYEGNATSVTYQWYRTDRNGTPTAISGATGNTYTPIDYDIGNTLYVIVTASDANHTGVVYSQYLTVGRLPGSITIGCADVTYGQTPSPYVVSNTNPEAPMWYTYTGRGDTVYAASRTPPTEAGTYSVSAYVELTVTHSAATSNTVEFSILPADSSVSAPPAAVQDLVYTGQPQALVTAGTADGGTMVYSLDGETYTAEIPTATDAGTYTVWYMVQGDSNHNNSTPASVEVTIAKATAVLTLTASPESLRGRGTVTLTLTGVPEGESATVTCDNGITVTSNSDGTWTATLPNETRTYTFTAALTENDNYEATPVTCTVDVTRRSSSGGGSSSTRPSGPSTDGSKGWSDIQDEIADAKDGDTIVIDMDGETEVPGEIFEAVAGKDVDVIFQMDDDISWTVNGQDVPENTNIRDLDLGVDMGTSGIPVNVINAITGEVGTVQITLAHDGEFGFVMTLTAPLGRENAGYWANLYHYDKDGGRMTFETAARIASNGDVSLRLSHASQYAIVIDEISHELPFEDVVDGAWYYDAVAYAYANGLMSGTSSTTFAPDVTTSRGMIAAILWRIADSPVVNYLMDYDDVAEGSWYTEAIRWATSEGVVSGYGNGMFGPDDPITREQFAVILYRCAQYMGCDVTARADLSRYTDADQISGYAAEALAWANAEGIVNGTGGGSTLSPQGEATRAQAAVMLMRFCQRYIDNAE